MSPAAQELFMTQIAPILIAAAPRVVVPVGAEDADELVQDALVAACEAVHRLEKRGKQIIPKSVAYYTLQRLKTGRRSMSAGRTDVMSPGCQLDGNSSLSSLDEPVHVGDDNEDLLLGDVLATRKDDPAQVAVRNADWGAFMAMLDGRQQYIVKATAEGESYMGQAAHLRVTPAAITQRKLGRRAQARGHVQTPARSPCRLCPAPGVGCQSPIPPMFLPRQAQTAILLPMARKQLPVFTAPVISASCPYGALRQRGGSSAGAGQTYGLEAVEAPRPISVFGNKQQVWTHA